MTGAYALDALDPEERAFVERHLAVCDTCRAEVRELREAAASLGALAEEAPSQRMRAAVLTTIADIAQDDPSDPVERVGRRFGHRVLAAVAGILAIAVLALGATVAYLVAERAGQATLAGIAEEAQVLALAGDADDRGAVVYHQGDAVLIVTGLEPLSEDETYQVWTIRNGKPQSAGLLSTEADGTAIVRLDAAVATADAVAVSREAAGGAEGQPQGPIVLSSANPAPPADR